MTPYIRGFNIDIAQNNINTPSMSLGSEPCQGESSPHKRKRLISDFFVSKRHASAGVGGIGPPNIAPKTPRISSPTIPGLTIIRDFVSKDEEDRLLSFLNDPAKCRWRTDLNRRCMHFGGTYCLFKPPNHKASSPDHQVSLGHSETRNSTPQVLQAPPMPSDLSWLIDRFIARGVFGADQLPQYCIVNEYVDAQGISAHVENFSFGEPVVGLSLLSPVHMRFRELEKEDGGSVRSGKAARADKTGRIEDVLLEGRSLCVMRGESRWKWQHEIPRTKKGRGLAWKRVSLTFRWKEGG